MRLTVSLAGITKLQLIAKSGGGEDKGNYAIWGTSRRRLVTLIKRGASLHCIGKQWA